MATSGLQDMPSIAFARAEWLNANQALAQAFTDAIVDGIHFAKTNPDFTKQRAQAVPERRRIPELLDVSYSYFTGANLNRVPDPGARGARRYLTEGPGAQAIRGPPGASPRRLLRHALRRGRTGQRPGPVVVRRGALSTD